MVSTPIRVLQIMGIVESGGVEAVILNYYRHIDKNKVQFDFVMHKGSNSNYIEEVVSMGARVYEITPYTQNIIKFTYEIYSIIKEGNYKIVHSNMNSLSGFPLMAAWLAGAKVRILHNHTTDSEAEGLRTRVKRLLRPFAKLFANKYWACSKLAAEWMYGKKLVENNKVTIINNAIDLDKFAFNQAKRDKLRKELGLEGKFVVGHVGRFVQTKNHEFLVDVFDEVVKQNDNARLLLIGDGPLSGLIKSKISSLNLMDKVIFLGVRSDMFDLYNVMDVFVLPSLYEGLPVVGVESQANGLPLLCSDNVTKEVVLSKSIEFIELRFGSTYWSEKVLFWGQGKRKCVTDGYDVKKFDINISAKKLIKAYVGDGMEYDS